MSNEHLPSEPSRRPIPTPGAWSRICGHYRTSESGEVATLSAAIDHRSESETPVTPPGSIIDPHRLACLCGAGAPDLIAAVCVTPGGGDELWLVSRSALCVEHPECGNPEQLHEQTGRLPATVRERIWGEALRCGRPRSDGQPCRHRVKEPGQRCRKHAIEAQQ